MKEDIGKKGDRPVFIERPSDKEVNEGGEVTFECVISGLPDPEVTWYFNGRELYVSCRCFFGLFVVFFFFFFGFVLLVVFVVAVVVVFYLKSFMYFRGE